MKKLGKIQPTGAGAATAEPKLSKAADWAMTTSTLPWMTTHGWPMSKSSRTKKGRPVQVPGRRAAFMAANGAPVHEVMTDNALAYIRSAAFANVMADLGAKHRRTKPRSPWQNGKAERFNRTFRKAGPTRTPTTPATHRTQALTGWLDFYNHRRNHSALGGRPPISRCNQPAG